MRTFLTLEEAWESTLSFVKRVAAEDVSLTDAYGRVLAEQVTAQAHVPPFDRSALDGYAVRAADVAGATPSTPVELTVIEEVPAGRVPERVVGAGEACRIMTGAPIPVGADAIVRQEGTERKGDTVRVLLEVPAGEAVSRQGEDAPQGTLLLEAGVVIGAAETTVLASNGAATVSVYRRPRVGILVSGEEVQALEGDLEPGQIRDSNGPMLAALVRDLGGEPISYGRIGDQMEDTVTLLQKMAVECDLILTTGGVSVGDYDLMRDAYGQAGGTVHFWKVTLRPGTPIVFADIGGVPVWGLSGNPAAAFVNFELLVKPVLRKMRGDRQPELRPVQAMLGNDIEAKVIGLDRFLRTHLTVTDGTLTAHVPNSGQKAAIITSLLNIQGLVRIQARKTVKQGSLVDVYPLGDTLRTNR
ncbi:MAG TPA: gephyrin-like molybdotransferase Glp [Bacilli bacterium]|nr:gephyrin-like molybdotransferase Glp [Bacilli bacterium]